MTVFRTDIERALEELISNEEGMKFQGLGVILAKQRWPELIACERKWDRGLDAHAPATLSTDGTGKGLACSLTATLEKIESDAKKSQQNFDDVKVFIFVTPESVTNPFYACDKASEIDARSPHWQLRIRDITEVSVSAIFVAFFKTQKPTV